MIICNLSLFVPICNALFIYLFIERFIILFYYLHLIWWQLLLGGAIAEIQESVLQSTHADVFGVSDEDVIKMYRLPSHLILNLLNEFRDDLEPPTKRSHTSSNKNFAALQFMVLALRLCTGVQSEKAEWQRNEDIDFGPDLKNNWVLNECQLIAAQLFLNWFDRLFVFLFRGMHSQYIQSLKKCS